MTTIDTPVDVAAPLPATAPQWVMLARVGAWHGHPHADEVITPEKLNSALNYFNTHYAAHGADLVVDYHHSSVTAAPQGGLAPAAGWVSRMEIRAGGDELWGHVLWTAEAAARVSRREFRYLSPALRFSAPDRVSGEPVPMFIHSVALTNTPFLTELGSLNACQAGVLDTGRGDGAPADGCALSDPSEGGDGMSLLEAIAAAADREPDQVAAALGLDDTTDRAVAAGIVANAARLTEADEARGRVPEFVANAIGLDPGAGETAVRAALIRLKAPAAGLAPIRSRLGLPDTADQAEILNAIGALAAAQRRSEAAELVNAAVSAGRIPPAHREFYLHEAECDPDAARQVINALPVLTAPHRAAAEPAQRELTDGEASICRQLGLSAEAFLRADA